MQKNQCLTERVGLQERIRLIEMGETGGPIARFPMNNITLADVYALLAYVNHKKDYVELGKTLEESFRTVIFINLLKLEGENKCISLEYMTYSIGQVLDTHQLRDIEDTRLGCKTLYDMLIFPFLQESEQPVTQEDFEDFTKGGEDLDKYFIYKGDWSRA